MHNIEWKTELSVGIKNIDDDHQRLIELTNKLITAIDREIPQKEILKIFEELEAYTHYHFKREESFMDTACSSEDMSEQIRKHKEQHRYFTAKLSILKETLMHASTRSVSYEIVEFLLHWLIDHIINEDLKLTQCLKTNQPNKLSLLQRTGDTLKKKTSLQQRLWFILALPLLFFVLQSLFISYNAYNKYSQLQEVQDITRAVVNINNVITELQKERVLSIDYISSDYHHFHEKLLQQRKRSDQIIAQSLYSRKILKAHVNIDNGILAMQKLKKIRTAIDTRQLSKKENLTFYTNFIETLIDIIKDISYLPVNSLDQNTYSPLLLLLHLNEIHGLIRNEGITCLEVENTSRERFSRLLNSSQDYYKAFSILAPKYLKDAITQIDISDNTLHIRQIQEQILKGTLHGNEAAQTWFSVTSQRIEKYKVVIKQILQKIDHDAFLEKKHFATLILTVWIIFILILLFIGISIYLFKKSILHPIEVLTSALHKLSTGDKSVHFGTVNKKDAIGKMEHAYNHLRRSLIKADYNNILMELQELKTQKYERLSAEDPLTGIFNRRAFMHALESEIVQVKRSNTPLSLLVLDIDRFKQINDTFGHEIGDLVLQYFVQRIRELIRNNDIFARIGGEEFALLLPDTSQEEARILAERVIQQIELLDLTHIVPTLKMTVSIGLSFYEKNMSSRALIQKADKHLYKAKNTGRNQFFG